MFFENRKEEQRFAIALVDEEYPDIDNEDFIYDLSSIDGKLIITQDFNDTAIEDDQLLFVTEYTRFEIIDVNDLKQAISKKKVVQNLEVEDDGIVISSLSEEQPFMDLFGDEILSDITSRNFYYHVKKGKVKKMKAINFYNNYLAN